MSSTNRGAERRVADAYYTPPAVARACVGVLQGYHNLGPGARILEPHVGGGAWIEAVAPLVVNHGAEIYAIEVDPAAKGLGMVPKGHAVVGDFLRADVGQLQLLQPPRRPWFTWCIGNPPWTDVTTHIDRALDVAERVAFVLRLNLLGSLRRKAWFEGDRIPIAVWTLVPRPSFTGGGTDSCEYALFVWARERDGQPCQLGWLDWRDGHPTAWR